MSIQDADQIEQAVGAQMAWADFHNGKGNKNPYSKIDKPNHWYGYKTEWESLDYQQTQIIAHHLEACGV